MTKYALLPLLLASLAANNLKTASAELLAVQGQEPPYQRIGPKLKEALIKSRQLQSDVSTWPECNTLFFHARAIGETIYGVEMDCLCLSGPQNAITCTTKQEICCGPHCGTATNTIEFIALNEVQEEDLGVNNYDLLFYEDVCFTYSDLPEGEREPIERCVNFQACTPQREGHEVQCACMATLQGGNCRRCTVCTENPTTGAPIFAALSDCSNVRNDEWSPDFPLCQDLRSMQEVSGASLMYCLPRGREPSSEYTGGLNENQNSAGYSSPFASKFLWLTASATLAVIL